MNERSDRVRRLLLYARIRQLSGVAIATGHIPFTDPLYTKKPSEGKKAGTIISRMGSVKIRRLERSSSQAPRGGSTATTEPSSLVSFCGRSKRSVNKPPMIMMTMNEM